MRIATTVGLIVLVTAVFCTSTSVVQAGEVDILIEKLVERGILSPSDAREIAREVQRAAQKEHEQVVRETKEAIIKEQPALAAGVPQWIGKTTFTGDFRLRYQFNDRGSEPDRHRGRYRLRLGCTTEVTDSIRVGFGLATGGTDPRSTNQSMTNSFETPDIRLDYAYVSYRPFSWLTLIGGKYRNPLWYQRYFLFDTDIRPEGFSLLLKHRAAPFLDLFCTAGFWILDERSGDENDPTMVVLQPGCTLQLGREAYLKNAVTLYQFSNVEGTTLDHSGGSNRLERPGGVLRHDYDTVCLSGELGARRPLGLLPFCALYADYITNRTISRDDQGFLIGFRLGAEKVSRPRQWQVAASYRRLERDAWLDIFPDADVYSGRTNIKGYQAGLRYGLKDNVRLDVTGFFTERIKGKSRSENIVQADLNITF